MNLVAQRIERLNQRIEELTVQKTILKIALRQALWNTRRANILRMPDYTPYGVDWTPDTRQWAKLCGSELSFHNPALYVDGVIEDEQ